MIGLDVKYGSRLLVHQGENGYLIDFEPGRVEEEKIVDRLAEKMIEIFADQERLGRFHECSYEIAGGFMSRIVEEEWERLLQGYS